jgi:Uma2 family endonuclease
MNDRILNQSGKKVSADDYIKAERQGGGRNEYIDGRIMPKAAGNRWHNLIATNTAIAVGSRLAGNRTEIYINGMRVQLKSDLICYPDVVMVNGTPTFTDQNADILRNPTIVLEIFSSATSPIDKTQKLESYLAIDSVKESLLVKADEMRDKMQNSGFTASMTNVTM